MVTFDCQNNYVLQFKLCVDVLNVCIPIEVAKKQKYLFCISNIDPEELLGILYNNSFITQTLADPCNEKFPSSKTSHISH